MGYESPQIRRSVGIEISTRRPKFDKFDKSPLYVRGTGLGQKQGV